MSTKKDPVDREYLVGTTKQQDLYNKTKALIKKWGPKRTEYFFKAAGCGELFPANEKKRNRRKMARASRRANRK